MTLFSLASPDEGISHTILDSRLNVFHLQPLLVARRCSRTHIKQTETKATWRFGYITSRSQRQCIEHSPTTIKPRCTFLVNQERYATNGPQNLDKMRAHGVAATDERSFPRDSKELVFSELNGERNGDKCFIIPERIYFW
jgi:hypothetical protein